MRNYIGWRNLIMDNRRKAVLALGAVALVWLALLVWPARADFDIVDRVNPTTGIKTVGLRIASTDRSAALFFICQSHSESPRIIFEHGHILAQPAKNPFVLRFRLAYRIDGGELKKSEFYLSTDGKGGVHALPSAQKTKLEGSDYFDKEKLDAALARDLERYQQSKFLSGAKAVVQVWDSNDKAYSYDFELVGASSQIDILSECHTPVS